MIPLHKHYGFLARSHPFGHPRYHALSSSLEIFIVNSLTSLDLCPLVESSFFPSHNLLLLFEHYLPMPPHTQVHTKQWGMMCLWMYNLWDHIYSCLCGSWSFLSDSLFEHCYPFYGRNIPKQLTNKPFYYYHYSLIVQLPSLPCRVTRWQKAIAHYLFAVHFNVLKSVSFPFPFGKILISSKWANKTKTHLR